MSDNEDKSTDDQTSSELKMEIDKKHSHSEIEKRRRDKMNQYINDLSTMIPLPPSVGKKPDKLTVLKFTVQHMKALQGSTEPLKETMHKPSFMSDDDLRNLISEATGGFIIVVECDRGQVLYVTDSVEEILNISQDDMVGFDFYELVHKKDVSMVKTQLYTTSSDVKEEKLDVKKSSMLKEEIDSRDNICPGAKRSFLCRMKKGATADDVKNIGTKTSSRKTKTNVLLDEKDPILISFEGYLKSWPPKTEMKSSKDPDSRTCLVAVGRVFEIDNEQTDYSQLGQIREFETRQRADATFVRVDQSFTKITGYLPDDVIGTSAYNFFHKDDLKIVAEAHHKSINKKCISRHDNYVCRFRAKDGHYVPLKTTAVVFRNPWTKDVDYIITRSVIVSPMSFSAMQRERENKTSPKQQDEMDENLRNLLLKLENLENSQTKSQRKRGLGTNTSKDGDSQKINSPSDIGDLIAEEAKKVGQQLRSSSQSAKYSNVEKSKEVEKTASNDTTISPRGSPALEQYRQSNDAEVADGILMEQLAGIRGAIDAMENTENSNEEEDSLSLIMNVIENEDLSSVLDDMPWNFM